MLMTEREPIDVELGDVNCFPSQSLDANNLSQESNSKLGRAKDFVGRRKNFLAVTGAIGGLPAFVGSLEGLGPVDAIKYGTLQWLTLGNEGDSRIGDTAQGIVAGGIQTAAEVALFGALAKLYIDYTGRTQRREDSIMDGTAKVKPEGEQIVMLGGTSSHIVDFLAATSENGRFIPVLESSKGVQEFILHNQTRMREGKGIFLNLGFDKDRNHLSYLESRAWSKLDLTRENLIHAENGHRYLMIVGCGELADRELSLSPDDVDVSHDDLRSSILKLKALLKPGDLVEDRDIIDVYIGNAAMDRVDAEDRGTISDRELARKTGVDIYVDTWGLVLSRLAQKISDGTTKEVSLASTNDEYSQLFRNKFEGHLLKFPGCEELKLTDINDASEDSTWIVYEGRSDETFLIARRLRKQYPNRRVIALLSDDKVIENMQYAGVDNVEFLCASSILAEAVVGIRNLIKKGFSPQRIQELLDATAPPIQEVKV